MSCLRGKCGCYARSPWASDSDLGKRFQRFSAACGSCVCRAGYAGADGTRACVGSGERKPVPERIEWLRRYRVHLADGKDCDCRSASPEEYWYGTNRQNLVALSQTLELPVDRVADFLYTLTMQNFSRMLKPRSTCFDCRVPLCKGDPCTLYASVFDDEGNVRNPFGPGTLVEVLRVLQMVVREGVDEPPNAKKPTSTRSTRVKQLRDEKQQIYAQKPQLDEKLQIYAPKRLLTHIYASSPLDYRNAPFATAPVEPQPSSVHLRQLISHINRVRGTEVDLAQFLEKTDLDAALPAQKRFHNLTKYEVPKVHKKLSVHQDGVPTEKRKQKWADHMYLGEQIPVLMHKPFNPNERQTYLRRHPASLRMNQDGCVVNSKNVHRYRRRSVERLLREARKRASIHSIVTVSPDNLSCSRKRKRKPKAK
ncbi:hypothetical protein AWZ03_007610 [Drosophila navojoa]|uniref:Uncharacterized protein n=1 Tax=Drosophila navojoa TaxID=7232 RepID=A0A484BD06_DRONA|nr:hypothetical protein AWZ03_007610 [Drosophila navojoa]